MHRLLGMAIALGLACFAHGTVGNIGGNCVVEQHHILTHQCDVGTQAGQRQAFDIDAVEQNSKWERPAHVSSAELYDYLQKRRAAGNASNE